MKDKIWKRLPETAAYVLVGVMALSLIPIMYLGRYNHPTGDDYYYGVETRFVWEETGSLLATMAEAAKGVAYQYENWQGTYSAMFLMYLPPNIFGDGAYRCITCGILLLLSGSIFYLMKQIICGLLKASKELWLVISSLVVLLCVQTVPSQGETFFWYNGSMYYTGYYAITLILFGILLRYIREPKKYHIPILAGLAVFVAGGNYVSLLPAILVAGVMAVLLIRQKSGRAWGCGIVAVVMTAGLLVSAAAPGNAVRQSDMLKIPAWKAILKSLLQGVNYTKAWIGIWWIIAAILLAPVLWKAFSQIKFEFRYPLIVIGLAYGIFCSMSCPTFYTMNSTGPARAVAIVYYGFMLFSFGAYIYMLGYLYQWMERKQLYEKWEERGTYLRKSRDTYFRKGRGKYFRKGRSTYLKCGVYAVAVLLVGVQLFSGSAAQTSAGKALRILASGEAESYEQEYQERMHILEDPDVVDVVFEPYVNRPDMLYVGDLPGDVTDPTSQRTAQYFKKNSVTVQY